MKKLPALQFYPGDWKKDPGVQSLNLEERAIWFEFLLLMHECPKRGYLMMNNEPIQDSALARLLGTTKSKIISAKNVFLSRGICSIDQENRAIYCRRMVREESRREICVSNGKHGGRPKPNANQTTNQNDNQDDNQTTNQNGGSSSSSSSSSSTSVRKEKVKKEKSPVVVGKEFCRISEAEMVLVQERYHRDRLPLELIPLAIDVIEDWLAKGEGKALTARGKPTHYRYVYETWVVQKALVARENSARATGEPQAPRFPTAIERAKARESLVPDQVSDFMEQRRKALAAKRPALSGPTKIKKLLEDK